MEKPPSKRAGRRFESCRGYWSVYPDSIDDPSRGSAFVDGSAAKVRALDGWGHVGLANEGADVSAGRDDLIDPVEDLVSERDVEAGEQVVELLHGVRPEERAGHARMSDRERHGEVCHRQSRLFGEWNELFHGVEPALVVQRLAAGSVHH